MASTVSMAQHDFESLAKVIKEDVQQFVRKEFVAKEATLESKMERNKQ